MDKHSQGRGHVEGKAETDMRHPQAEECQGKCPQAPGATTASWIFSESLQRKHGPADTFEGSASKTVKDPIPVVIVCMTTLRTCLQKRGKRAVSSSVQEIGDASRVLQNETE